MENETSSGEGCPTSEQVLLSLAQSMAEARHQLDAMCVVLHGMLNTMAADSQVLPRLAEQMRIAVDIDRALTIATPLTPATLAQRKSWLERLMPLHLKQIVLQP